MVARGLHRFIRFVITRLVHIRAEGLEHLPAGGPYILAANHLAFWDAPVIYGLVGGPHLTGWAAEKYRYNPIWGTILRMGSGVFIDRGEVDRDALQAAVNWLRQGKVFGLAPEGGRSKTGGLARGKSGVVFIAHQAGVPIVPLAHFGTERVARTWLRLHRPVVTVRIGPAFTLPPLAPTNRSAQLHAQADVVMCHIAALLPPEYRGVYADHPHLRRLLSEAGSSPR
jgi:1-acyl-sn-glycerol-3-phosphate acyltransferase